MYICNLYVIIKLSNSTDQSPMVDDRLLKGNHITYNNHKGDAIIRLWKRKILQGTSREH